MRRDRQPKEVHSVKMSGGVIKFVRVVLAGLTCFVMASCAEMDPHNVDVQLPESKPEVKVTSYTKALSDLGRMTEIYSPGELKIQSQDIADKTGASASTGSEIQRNITEIMKSTLNSIGGQVTFIEYDPSFIQNQMVTGYSNFEGKVVPDVVITGGITEFDRGLETHGEGTNLDADIKASGLPKWVPGDTVGFGYGDTAKEGKARITLDFNLKDFQTLAGILKMTTTNSMEVFKGLHEKEIGITFFGPTFGRKGSTKRVQGRHEAVRVLVQLSMIQMVGKYLALPYWKLLGDDALPDPVVTESIKTSYYNMDDPQRVMAVQQWIYLHGYDVDITGELDNKTLAALNKYDSSFSIASTQIPEKLFSKIYLNIPHDHATLARRNQVNEMLYAYYSEQVEQAEPEPEQVVEQQYVEQQVAEQQYVEQQAAVEAQVEAAPAPAPAPRASGLGRKLTDDEW